MSSLRRRIPLSSRTPLLEANSETIELGELGATELAEFGTFESVEAAAAALDSTGVGAPLGIAVGALAALGFGAYEIYEHFKTVPQIANHPKFNPTTVENYVKRSKNLLAKNKRLDGSSITDPSLKKNLIKKVETVEVEHPGEAVPSYGIVVPPYKYLGPGNSLERGFTHIQVDQDAQQHDHDYTNAKTQKDIEKSDTQFLQKTGDHIVDYIQGGGTVLDTVGAIAGGIGIGTKFAAEKAVGPIYPNPKQDSEIGPSSAKQATGHHSRDSIPDPSLDHKTPTKNQESPAKPTGSATSPEIIGEASVQPIPADMSTGTGKDQAAGGGDSTGQIVHRIPRPFTNFGDQISVYTKVHKLMTFGLAPKIFAVNTNDSWLGTYLAEVPWELPVMYLNPSEFGLLPIGSRVESLNVKVIYRQSVIQFPTAASTAGLATLNQISDIGVAHALNKTGWGSNVNYSGFETTKPMIPTGVRAPRYISQDGAYRGLQQELYGENQSSGNFRSFIPKHQLGNFSFVQNYFALSTIGTNTQPRQLGGWPCLVEKIEQYDGKTCINSVIAESTYKPKVAPLKDPLKNWQHGLPWPGYGSSIKIPSGGNIPNSFISNFKNNDNATAGALNNREISTTDSNFTQTTQTFDIYTPIEKSQIYRSGLYGQTDPHIQPSLHIGVQPIPSLTTTSQAAGDGAYSDWTDTRGYFEVICTMVVKSNSPTAYPYAPTANVPIGEQMFQVPAANVPAYNKNPADAGASWGGLYTIEKPTF